MLSPSEARLYDQVNDPKTIQLSEAELLPIIAVGRDVSIFPISYDGDTDVCQCPV